jgi:hypothetical protein
LGRYHEDAIDVRRGDGDRSSNGPDSVVTERGEEVLSSRAIVPELAGVLANEIPAREAQFSDFCQHAFSVHRLEVFLLVHIGAGGEAHVTFDDGDVGIAQPDLVAGIDAGSRADRRCIR